MELTLAIDLGTSGPKLALANATGDIVRADFEPTPLILCADGGVEQDPHGWWRAIVTAAHRLLRSANVSANDVAAVCCTGQWSGTVAVDERGEPLGNAIIWMDSRGAADVQRICRGYPTVAGYGLWRLLRWLRLTGGAPGHGGKDAIAHILYLKNHHPKVYERARVFLEPKDYINLRLTGVAAATYDSIALHWVTDNRRADAVRYDAGLLACAGVDADKLPPLCQATTALGRLSRSAAAELGLRQDTEVIAGTPDIHSAAIGSGLTADYAAHLYIGTSSWLVCHTPRRKLGVRQNMASLPSAVPGRYLAMNAQESAGKCIARAHAWLDADGDAGPPTAADFEAFESLARKAPPGSHGLIFLPWLCGERAPVNDSNLRGGFVNMALDTSRADVARAVYEGVAMNTRWLRDALVDYLGRPLDAIRFVGGGAQSRLWSQILADALDQPILQCADPILCNARGAAVLASVARGRVDFSEADRKVKVDQVFEPSRTDKGLYDTLLGHFLACERRDRRLYQRLAGWAPPASSGAALGTAPSEGAAATDALGSCEPPSQEPHHGADLRNRHTPTLNA